MNDIDLTEAIEAAAPLLHLYSNSGYLWDDLTRPERDARRVWARRVLEAALPHISDAVRDYEAADIERWIPIFEAIPTTGAHARTYSDGLRSTVRRLRVHDRVKKDRT